MTWRVTATATMYKNVSKAAPKASARTRGVRPR